MSNKSKKIKHKNKICIIMILSILFSYSIGTYFFNHSLKGVVNSLDSVLLFVSIIVGFIGASLSVFATVSDTKFAMKLKKSPNSKKQFINTLVVSLINGVVLIALTIVYQLLILNSAPNVFLIVIKYIWLFLIPLFIGFGYIIVNVIMQVLFAD